jgi:hypothetical protein
MVVDAGSYLGFYEDLLARDKAFAVLHKSVNKSSAIITAFKLKSGYWIRDAFPELEKPGDEGREKNTFPRPGCRVNFRLPSVV